MKTEIARSVVCIVVNWNGWADTLQCVESLSRSTYGYLSLVLVDNGSTNDSVARIRAAFPDLEVIESPVNLGFGTGNNLGIRWALERGAKYVWLLNNDTIVEHGTLAALVAAAESDTSLGAVGSVLHYMHAPKQVQAWGGGHVNLWMGTSHHFHQPVPWSSLHYLTAASVLIPVKVLQAVGLFDERYFMYWEDTDLSFRIRAAGWKLGVASEATLLHKEAATTGAKGPVQEHYASVSGIRFMRKFSPVPIVAIFNLIISRTAKRALFFQWKRAWAVFSALFEEY